MTALRSFANDTFQSFQTRNYRTWIIGEAISQTGFWVQLVGQGLLVLRLTDSGTIVGVAAAAQFMPILVIGPWAGVLSDRLDKRRLLQVTQAITMVAAFALGALELSGNATLPGVLVLVSVAGTAFAFDQPSRRTIVTELVPDEHLANAVSLNASIGNVAKVVGPAVAGFIVSAFDIGWCFALNACASLGVLLALALMDSNEIRRPEPISRASGQIREGFQYVRHVADARLPMLMLAPVAILGFNWTVLLPLLATRDLDGDAATYGLLMGVMSVGSVVGTLWLARRKSAGIRFLSNSCITFGLVSCLLAVAPTLATAAAVSIAVGATSMVVFNGGIVGMHLGANPAFRGRVMGIFGMVIVGGYGLGGPVSGWIAERFGARVGIGLGAATALAVGISGLTLLRERPANVRVGTRRAASAADSTAVPEPGGAGGALVVPALETPP